VGPVLILFLTNCDYSVATVRLEVHIVISRYFFVAYRFNATVHLYVEDERPEDKWSILKQCAFKSCFVFLNDSSARKTSELNISVSLH
jgi:hypothetical protein